MKPLLVVAAIVLAVLVASKTRAPRTGSVEPVSRLESSHGAPVPLPNGTARPVEPAKAPETTPPKPDPIIALLDRLQAAIDSGDHSAITEIVKALIAAWSTPEIPDETNGALVLMKAFEKLDVEGLGGFNPREALQGGEDCTLQLPLMKSILARNAEALVLIREAAKHDRFRFPVNFEDGFNALLPHIPNLISANQVVAMECLVTTLEGADSTPSRDLLAKLAASVAAEPILISQLVRILQLRTGGIGDATTLRSMAQKAVLGDLIAGFKYGLDNLPENGLSLPDYRQMAQHFLGTMRAAMDLIGQPWLASRGKLAELQDGVDLAGPEATGTRLLMPSFTAYADDLARAELALNPTIDPFSGKPLLQRGNLRYSVGPDGRDDGGDPKLDVLVR